MMLSVKAPKVGRYPNGMELLRYDDWLVRSVILVPVAFIVVLNKEGLEMYREAFSSFLFYVAVGCSYIIAQVVMWYLSLVARKLDERGFFWRERTAARFGWQLLFGFAVSLALAVALAAVYFRVVRHEDIWDTKYFSSDFIIVLLFVICGNGYYAGYYLWHIPSSSIAFVAADNTPDGRTGAVAPGVMGGPAAQQDDPVPGPSIPEMMPPPGDNGNNGHTIFIAEWEGRHIPIAWKDIVAFVLDDGIYQVKLCTGETIMMNQSLKIVEEEIDEDYFRANRDTIVHYSICGEYQNHKKSGQLKLWLKAPLYCYIIISRDKAAAFIRWINR